MSVYYLKDCNFAICRLLSVLHRKGMKCRMSVFMILSSSLTLTSVKNMMSVLVRFSDCWFWIWTRSALMRFALSDKHVRELCQMRLHILYRFQPLASYFLPVTFMNRAVSILQICWRVNGDKSWVGLFWLEPRTYTHTFTHMIRSSLLRPVWRTHPQCPDSAASVLYKSACPHAV